MIILDRITVTVNGRTYSPSEKCYEILWMLYFGVQKASGGRRFAYPTNDYKGPSVIDWDGFKNWMDNK